MPIEFLFTLSALVVAPFWLLMIGLPGFRFTQVVLRSPWVLLPLPLLYTVLLVAHGDRFVYLVVDPTLHGLMQVLGSPAGALIAWVHVLAFDLFVGRWIYLDSQDRGVASLAVVPVLWLTLLVGPVGLLAYLVLRPLIQPAEEPTPPPVAGPPSPPIPKPPPGRERKML
jgi:hypothetical protein